MPTAIGTKKANNAIRAIFPPGRLFTSVNDTFRLLVEAFAENVDLFMEDKGKFVRERSPLLSNELLPDYESIALHLEEMPNEDATLANRRKVVSAKLDSNYDFANPAFFIAYAARIGVSIEIVEGVEIGFPIGYAFVGDSLNTQRGYMVWKVLGSSIHPNWLKLQKVFMRLRPGHTYVIFADSGDFEDSLDEGTILEDSFESDTILEDSL